MLRFLFFLGSFTALLFAQSRLVAQEMSEGVSVEQVPREKRQEPIVSDEAVDQTSLNASYAAGKVVKSHERDQGGVPAADEETNESDAPLGAVVAQKESITQSSRSATDRRALPQRLEPNAIVKDSLASLDSVELLARATEVERELALLRKELKVPKSLGDLREWLTSQEADLVQAAAAAQKDISKASRWFLIVDIQFDFAQRLFVLESKRAPLDRFASSVGHSTDQLTAIVAEWSEAVRTLSQVGAPATLLVRSRNILQLARLSELRLRRAESALVQTSASFERMKGTVDGVLELSRTSAPSLFGDFTHRSTESLGGPFPSPSVIFTTMVSALRNNAVSLVKFIQVSAPLILVHLFLSGFLFFALLSGRKFTANTYGDEMVLQHLVLRHPYAGATLLSVLLTIPIYPVIPSIVSVVAISIGIVASNFLLVDEPTRENRLLAFGGLLLVIFLILHLLVVDLPIVERLMIGVEGIIVLLLSFQVGRSNAISWEKGWLKLVRLVVRVWLAAVLIGLGTWALGFDRSSSILIDGTARLILITIAYRVSYDLMVSVVVLGVQSPWARGFKSLKNHGELIAARVTLVLRWAFFALWCRALVQVYTLSVFLSESWDSFQKHQLQAGSLSVEVGTFVTLIVGVVLAVIASRFVRFVLKEEVLPRTPMGQGSRAAVTSSAGYVILGFGIFTSLAAVGFELEKITIVVSALGVGIGFGLQNIVQNFVAGLILIFGRPINVGDRVEVGGLLGTVTEVGFRASTVHTIQGAEVIVPNSQFVSDQVINWSLSDDLRRIEVDIGVKYGTEPQQVIDILLAAARVHPDVIEEPAPDAIFVAFGASSLDFQLRAWTAHGANWMNIRSDLSIFIDKEFKKADIEIPFPQRDLHLRTVDQEAIARLQRLSNKTTSAPSEE